MQKRIFLTGSNGLLGQKIVPLLADRMNVRLMATSRGINRHPIREGYVYESVDLLDKLELATLFDDFKPTDLIHTAAMTQVDLCEDEHSMCDRINVEVVAFLASLCKKYGTRMVHISTDFIFDGENGPYTENDTPNPVNYYGLSKLKAEEAVLSAGIEAVILRTILLYGVTPDMSRSNIILWAKKSLEAGKEIRVVSDQVRCPTLVEDLAMASVAAVMKGAKGIYHISGAEMMPIIDIARQVAAFWKLDENLISETTSASLNQRAKRPPVTGFIILKAQTELGYRPHSLDQGLAIVDRQLKEMEESF